MIWSHFNFFFLERRQRVHIGASSFSIFLILNSFAVFVHFTITFKKKQTNKNQMLFSCQFKDFIAKQQNIELTPFFRFIFTLHRTLILIRLSYFSLICKRNKKNIIFRLI